MPDERISCPDCGSYNVYACDNEPLNHDHTWLMEEGLQFDNELYLKFKCHTCTLIFTKTFNLIPYAKEN